MKKYIFFAAAALALSSCSNDEPAVNTGNGEVKVTANLSSGRMSRANGENWEADAIGVMVTGSTSGMDAIYRNVKYTTASTGTTADFAPEGKGIYFQDANETVTFAAYAPYQTSSADNALPGDAADGVIAASTAAQSTRELQKAFDFIYASGATASRGNSTVNFAFSHVMTKLTIVVKPGKDITLDDIKSGNFTLSGLKHDGSFSVTTGVAEASGDANANWSLSADAISSEGIEGVTFTAILFPQTLKAALGFNATVDGQTYANNAIRPDLVAGNSYTYNVTVNKTGLTVSSCTISDWNETPAVDTDAEMSKPIAVGDFLLVDGTIVSKDTPITDELKAKVAAIVYWTPAMTTTEGRLTPASLNYDKIMTSDYPDCIHGLAVAIKKVTYNGANGMKWQESPEAVRDWQDSENFTDPRKADFVSVGASHLETGTCNRILGYQNTVVLRAYNEYCKANDKNANMVIPIAALDEFAKENPAPARSSGWFMPSAKELHMIASKDVDHIWNTEGRDVSNILAPLITAVGGDAFGDFHWASSEMLHFDGSIMGAYIVRFPWGITAWSEKNDQTHGNNVRAVCVF